MFARIRKAVIAGASAGAGAGTALVLKAGNLDDTTIAQALGACVVAGVVTGLATWRTPNAR